MANTDYREDADACVVTLQENIMDSRHHSKASVAIAASLVALIGISAVWLLRVFWFHV